jgi:hypothetical protein
MCPKIGQAVSALRTQNGSSEESYFRYSGAIRRGTQFAPRWFTSQGGMKLPEEWTG